MVEKGLKDFDSVLSCTSLAAKHSKTKALKRPLRDREDAIGQLDEIIDCFPRQ